MIKGNKQDASIAFLQQAGPGKTIMVYRDKEVLYSQQSPADAIFYLQSGLAKLTIATRARRKKAVVAILQAGDIFGECSLGIRAHRISTATSIGTSTITRVERAAFNRKIGQDPAFASMFIGYLVSQTARYKADLADHFLNSSEKRLARLLLLRGSLVQKSSSGYSTLRFSQSALAEMVGTTRARVNGFMNEFREKGYIRYNGGLEIDALRLTAFLQD
jgi:CRP/FNR family transcriptional regulator, cyclic AMP receptor protein